MQRFYTLLTSLCCLLLSTGVMAQTFVKHDAGGNNDGSDWDNAYTDLSVALANTSSGAIWVASGTYLPGSGAADSSSTFKIQGNVSLYGGFAGTESSLEDRDIMANETILSGDINGDDVDNDFTMNKGDNVQHVIVVDSLLNPITIDGLTIRGGNTSDFSDQEEFFWRGGGIIAYSTVHVSHCNFNNNFGRSGAGVYVSPAAGGGSGSSFTSCNFYNNSTSAQSAGIFLLGLSDIIIEDCVFEGNTTVRGALYPNSCNNITINNCLFESNEALFIDGFGGALFNWQSTGITVSNTDFRGNTAGNGAVMYHDGREAVVDPKNLVFDNCTFENNVATDWGGGALYVWRGSFEIHNSTFSGNEAPNTGAHFYAGGDDKEVLIRDCSFENGSSGWGAGHACYGANSNYQIINNEYKNGEAATSGGAIINGFLANVTIDSCSFEDNSAGWGGAIYGQNDSTRITINNSTFIGNECLNSGGAVNIAGGVFGSIDHCLFEGNTADFGGGVSFSEGDAANEATFSLSNSIFNFNLAETQAGALNLNDVDVTITSTVFANNINSGDYGGAISNNASDSNTVVVDIINSTFVDNFAGIGAGIAQWTGTVETGATMTVQNCIFSNPDGNNYTIEDGTPTLVSNGGNLVNADDMMDLLTHAMDIHEADPMFLDADNFDYHLLGMSPAIDAGVNEGAPEFDIDGNPRVGNVDIGAYEFYTDVSTEEVVIENEGQLSAFPNPFQEQIRYELDNEWSGALRLSIRNILGQELYTWELEKGTKILTSDINLSTLSAGQYFLSVSNGKAIISLILTKI